MKNGIFIAAMSVASLITATSTADAVTIQWAPKCPVRNCPAWVTHVGPVTKTTATTPPHRAVPH